MMKNRIFFVFLALALLAASPSGARVVPQTAAEMQASFAPLVKKTAPAVVNIYAKRVVKEQLRVISPFFNDPFFNQFFGGMGRFPGGVHERERVENALGSGVIVDPAGIIATNSHVIKGATEIVVVTADGREFSARKKLSDPQTDLAILEIDPKGEDLPFLRFADSDAIEVGDLVLAIGNPFGLGQTVTSGIVSGLARTGVGPTEYGFFIQTDAAINPGNSGGALVDVKGRLIGINSMIFSRSGGSMGIGFAIPANMVRHVVEASRTGDKVVRPWTGFTGQAISGDMTESLGLHRAAGVLVNRVRPQSPASAAGLRVGDIVTAINGHVVHDPGALQFRLGTLTVGEVVRLDILRNGREQTLRLKTVAPPEIPPRQQTEIAGRNPLQGAVILNLSPAVSHEIEGFDDENGVVVFSAEKGSAARLGLRRGDRIVAINGRRVDAVDDVLTILRAAGNGPRRWSFDIVRGDRAINLVVQG